ncbi:PorT family protein [Hymenobacter sp. BT635]|uniref:PorT family protein n=1 Tax=Hymenobacter nitidus TaxID=2880929 RepID=A0ABS8AIZ6_9BACT|nr:outer membrane beta-barrel protein [Hymenobacter nitidus]MCB2379972.1 PorT family protein [Hymenobacter nitidus]
MQKAALLLVALVAAASGATAQTTYRIGVRVGGNLAATSTEGSTAQAVPNASSWYEKAPIFTGQAGLVLEVARGNFAFQPALLFSQKGTKIKGGSTVRDPETGYEFRREGQTTARYNWLEMPLNFVYTLPGNTGLQVFAGPYVAVGVGGSAKTTINNTTTDPGATTVPVTRYTSTIAYASGEANSTAISIRDFHSRRFDTGFNVGVGYRRGPVQLQAGYGIGLVNLYYSKAGGNTDQSGYNRVAQLTGTYFLK